MGDGVGEDDATFAARLVGAIVVWDGRVAVTALEFVLFDPPPQPAIRDTNAKPGRTSVIRVLLIREHAARCPGRVR